MRSTSTRLILLACVGGGLLGIGSRVTSLWMFSLIAFVPIAVALFAARTTRGAFFYMFLTGLLAYGLSLHALFFDALPLTWLGVGDGVGIALITLIWAISDITFAFVFAAIMTFAYWVRTNTPWDILLVSCAYSIADWIGMWAFSLINTGPGALLGPHFTMGSPAYQLAADLGLSQVAFFGGIYALALVQAAVGMSIYYVWHVRVPSLRRVLVGIGCIGLTMWGTVSFVLPSDGGEGIRIGLVTLYRPAVLYPSEERTKAVFDTLFERIASVVSSTDVIILPEDSRFLSGWHERMVEGNAPLLPPVAIVDSGAVREEDGRLYSRIETYDVRTNTAQFSYKQYLMLFGEYMPSVYQFIGRVVGQGEAVAMLLDTRGFDRKGTGTSAVLDSASMWILLCSEAMSPILYVDGARRGAAVFINLASHSWFNNSHTLYQVAKWSGQIRAIESRRWYARSSDGTPSFILDPYGRTIAEGVWDDQSTLYGTIHVRYDMTPYVVLGQWVLLVPCAVLALFTANLVHKRHRPYSVDRNI